MAFDPRAPLPANTIALPLGVGRCLNCGLGVVGTKFIEQPGYCNCEVRQQINAAAEYRKPPPRRELPESDLDLLDFGRAMTEERYDLDVLYRGPFQLVNPLPEPPLREKVRVRMQNEIWNLIRGLESEERRLQKSRKHFRALSDTLKEFDVRLKRA